MVGWIILGSVLLLILILLMSWVTIIVDYDRDIFIKVKYFGLITIYRKPGKEKAPKKPKKSKKRSKKKGEDD